MNFIEELKWRGLFQEATPGTEEFFLKQPSAGYVGVDPTSDSMHIGNLFAIMMLVHLQRAGHTPIALVGGATGMVGDPSGKDSERQLLDEETINKNVEGIKKQMAHFLSFEGANAAIMVNNYDWFKNIGFLEFLRDVGKHITVNYMLAKDSVKKRLSGENREGISYTEFAYQLLQGYDYLWLYQHKGARLQMGGSDQWGNITTGTELIRRKLGHEANAFAVTCPLLTRPDGTKFGKTADGQSLWLDPAKTSPYEFYQYFLNLSDVDAEKLVKIFTLKSQSGIETLVAEHAQDLGRRALQKALAEDITHRVHGQAGLDNALSLTAFFFAGKQTKEDFAALSRDQWVTIAAASADKLAVAHDRMAEGLPLVDFMVEIGMATSKGEARRAIEKDKSVSINGESCLDPARTITGADLFYGAYLQINKGRKNRFLVEVA